jgi:hypothetical protein
MLIEIVCISVRWVVLRVLCIHSSIEELEGLVVSALQRAIMEVKQHWSVIGWVTKKIIISSSSVLWKAR